MVLSKHDYEVNIHMISTIFASNKKHTAEIYEMLSNIEPPEKNRC